ncbi:hypothetical protein [Nocardia shimofusensis]|uniref:hypothetical protein n=1 Tax=Nocardia shimofusensis TaxID=228596 RepID=UPI0012EEB437|nr:hypothetical protein [Nocardia shimofusensis]
MDPITSRMGQARKALLSDKATVARYGVAVDVVADGTLKAVRIDDTVTPYGAELGDLITRLAGEALEVARANVRDRIAEISADPRIAAIIDSIDDASERPHQQSLKPRMAREEELTEEELIELNTRRNQSWFR